MNKLENIKRVKIAVSGIVQGVGFRPTVYRYAHECQISGYVMNTPEGVTIEAQGKGSDIDLFIRKILEHPPALAKIASFNIENIAIEGEDGFSIIASRSSGIKEAEISPDIATCKDCLSDILDPNNRRYLYPFTNCTNCGPRFSIINDRPYDRKNTSMNVFKMCPDCQREYDDPFDRRFHAQPNACPKCGPSLTLLGPNGVLCDHTIAIREAQKLLAAGSIMAIKSVGGFNIACDPANIDAVNRLRIKKDRPSKAFAMMAKDLSAVADICHVSEAEKQALMSKTAPIVILRKKDNRFDHVSPDNNFLGIILPFTPLHHILLRDIGLLIMTSANKSDEPIAINNEQIKELMSAGIVDHSITHDREIIHRCDDSIVQFIGQDIQVIRRARGYVPTAFNVGNGIYGDTLSLGANLKNTFSIKKKNKVYMSQHIGDLSDLRNYEHQRNEISKLSQLMNFSAERINIDSHPGYENYDPGRNKVYHHHAHALGVMWENGLLGKRTLAVVCDGTGYGKDGNIWGFEFIDIGEDYKDFNRVSHLDYFVLPGGEKAIDEVDRIAVSLSSKSGRSKFIGVERYTSVRGLIEKGINCPKTSSLGRLFDGVASLCGIVHRTTYEAQAAIMLQKYAERCSVEPSGKYSVLIHDDVVVYEQMIEELINDINAGVSKEECSYKFHVWVVDSILSVVLKNRPENVVLSGGCFQNVLLCSLLDKAMNNIELKHFFNHEIPTNDAGISFGQSLL